MPVNRFNGKLSGRPARRVGCTGKRVNPSLFSSSLAPFSKPVPVAISPGPVMIYGKARNSGSGNTAAGCGIDPYGRIEGNSRTLIYGSA